MTGPRAFALAVLLAMPPAAAFASPAECVADDHAAIPDIALVPVADGFDAPVFMTHAGNGDGRLYVVEQAGRVRAIGPDGEAMPEPFLDIRRRVSSGGERGLLSIAFHPDYDDNDRLFVNYTLRKGGVLHTRISEFRRENDDAVNVHAERILLEIEQPFDNHNGGQIAFGPDGYLYIGMGDGGGADDPHGHGQNLGTLLGALLRIDVDGIAQGAPYAIPADNPYAGIRGARDEIWAHGLRNPWRFSFDLRNGALWLADVGQDHEEEIDLITPGGNYGWSIMEGSRCNSRDRSKCERRDLMAPIMTYGREDGRSVTGGYVSRDASAPGLCGVYLYGDYVSGRIWGLRQAGGRVTTQRALLEVAHAISSFAQGPDGEVYVVDHAGAILRIVSAENNGT